MDAVIIMPVYGQGPFLCESITSAVDQETDFEYRIILVDDNCPQDETIERCRRYARLYPNKVLYWRSPHNRGLAAMRNAGMRLALERWPDLFSVVYFDGDDRLHPLLIQRGIKALKDAQHENTHGFRYGWVFEHPDHFGIDGVMLRTLSYSSLFSMAGCANTSTSPMLADIFRSGLHYREDMKQGSEDWQFWLSALKNGFRGKYVPHIGFRYRLKAGSMAYYAFKQANRNRAGIRLSHPEIYHPDFFLQEENREQPRYSIVSPFVSKKLASTHGFPPVLDFSDYLDQLRLFDKVPTSPIPQFLFFAAPELLTTLKRDGLLDYVFWRMEMICGIDRILFSRVMKTKSDSHLIEITTDKGFSSTTKYYEILCISSSLVLDLIKGKTNFDNLDAQKKIQQTNFFLNNAPKVNISNELSIFLEQLKKQYYRSDNQYFQHKTKTWKPFGVSRYNLGDHFFGAQPILAKPNAHNDVLFVVEQKDMANIKLQQAARSLVQKLKKMNRECALLVIGHAVDKAMARNFDQVFLLAQVESKCQTRIQAGNSAALGLLLPFGAILSLGCTSIAPEFNQLRRYGRSILGVLPPVQETETTEMHSALRHCFKIFKGLYCFSDSDAALAEGMGVAWEQIVTNEDALLQLIGGINEIPK